MNNDGFAAGWNWVTQQVGRSVERLEDLDIYVARAASVDVDRARRLFGTTEQWLSDHAESVIGETRLWFGGVEALARGHDPRRGAGPQPLDLPTAAQGLALGELDSGRWTVKPGSHLLVAHGEGPAPADALGLVSELRARDWINADGVVTVIGRNALRRWMEHRDVA